MTRSNDGLTLMMSSSDGFCSTLAFSPGELGQPYVAPASAAQQPGAAVSTNSTTLPTQVTTKPSPAAQANLTQAPPASPARSNSVSSVTTQPGSGSRLINNPTPTLGSVPLVTATHSAQPPTLPLTTPPQTPMSAASQSGTSYVSNSVLGKRPGESEEDDKDQSAVPQTQQPKKRRVAPTLISAGTNPSATLRDEPPNTDVGG